MFDLEFATQAVLLVWAGVSLGGNLIAAPAKFQVKELELPMALKVGRAQFSWIGRCEWLLASVLLVLMVLVPLTSQQILFVPIICLLLQRLVLMRKIQRNTDAIIAGQNQRSQKTHVIFVAIEFLKFLSLMAAAYFV